MKLIERLIEEGGSDSSSRNFASPNISENVVRLVGRHFPSYVESDCSKKNIAKMCELSENESGGCELSRSNLDSDEDIRLTECDCEEYKEIADTIDNIPVNPDIHVVWDNTKRIRNNSTIIVEFTI
ncbi:hypothetical protein TNCV_1803531 [Trichonephila clavipes]|uniref:Uncharacterized protein n=1 Tax=Trichonephila clavipes TaxID=2585209 RepID=A0A8X6SQQ3_TRICX|nr:hypothetical protein TNCV_1803531 [Trichonephila clavipes]